MAARGASAMGVSRGGKSAPGGGGDCFDRHSTAGSSILQLPGGPQRKRNDALGRRLASQALGAASNSCGVGWGGSDRSVCCLGGSERRSPLNPLVGRCRRESAVPGENTAGEVGRGSAGSACRA